jgi:hypothetical protein
MKVFWRTRIRDLSPDNYLNTRMLAKCDACDDRLLQTIYHLTIQGKRKLQPFGVLDLSLGMLAESLLEDKQLASPDGRPRDLSPEWQ